MVAVAEGPRLGWLAWVAAAGGEGGLLGSDQGVGEAEVDLGGAVAAQLAAEGAGDDEVVSREGVDAGGDGVAAALAVDHEVGRADLALLAVVHSHRGE